MKRALVIALFAVAARADEPALFADANAAYLSGDVARATASYEALAAERIASPELETNLGAAWLRQGRRGLAALHFERALFLDPGDDDARADLTDLRRSNVDRLEGEADEAGTETLARLLAPLPGGAAAALMVLAWTAGWTLLGARLILRKPWGAAAAVAFVICALGGGVAFAAAEGRTMALQRAVVTAASTPAREGPNEKSASHFEVHEGTAVRVEDTEGAFCRVKLANGLTGWVPASALEWVVPPAWR